MKPSEFTVTVVAEFLRARRERYVDLSGSRALGPLLRYLRGLGVVPERTVIADGDWAERAIALTFCVSGG